MIKQILFDCGGVFVDIQFFQLIFVGGASACSQGTGAAAAICSGTAGWPAGDFIRKSDGGGSDADGMAGG